MDPALESGVSLFREKRYGEAYSGFRRLLQSQPDDARLWYYAALSYGLSTGDWGRMTQSMVEEGITREKAGKPPKSEIDAALAGLTKETGKDWLDFYRRRAPGDRPDRRRRCTVAGARPPDPSSRPTPRAKRSPGEPGPDGLHRRGEEHQGEQGECPRFGEILRRDSGSRITADRTSIGAAGDDPAGQGRRQAEWWSSGESAREEHPPRRDPSRGSSDLRWPS